MSHTGVSSPTRLHLYLFGSFRLERASQPVRLPTRKVESLLAYLALYPEPQPREKLAALFWGDTPDEQARGSLRKALTLLRQPLGTEIVLADRQTVQLNPDYPLWVDTRAFQQLELDPPRLAPGDRLTVNSPTLTLLELYRGDLLTDFYEDWIFPRREQYRLIYLETLLQVTQELRTRSEYGRAIEFAQKVLAADPTAERAHQHLMFCYLASGNRSAALKQYEECIRLLEQELAVPPLPETTALYRWLKQAPAGRPASEALITNLPIPMSSFIGREREMAEVKRLWQALLPGADGTQALRLLTLTGPGGSGKTRLAIQIATDLIGLFPEGVWWVELAPLLDGAHLAPAIAKTLGVCEVPDEPLITTLIAFLRPKDLLLVLDNCEHLIPACARLVAELLSQCPQLKIFATSREALYLPGEQLFPVPTLAVPRRETLSLAGLLLEFEGVRLFVERARAVLPSFALTEQNALPVSQICTRLDGIPLALELAATQVKTLSVEEIAGWLNDRFNLLTMGGRITPPRHQTLRSVLDWSHDLLPEAERVLFRRLSVFAGKFTLALMVQVCALPPGSSLPVELLSRLIDKSLVVAEPAKGQTCYHLLETIREYAREKLEAAGETSLFCERHLAVFVALAERAEIELRGPAQSRWLEQLNLEIDNLRAALEWALARDVQQGLKLAGALTWFWNIRGYWREGPAWLSRLFAVPGAGAPTLARAKALVAAGNLTCWGNNDYPAARAWLEEAIVIYRERQPSDRWGLGYALALYGQVLIALREFTRAQSILNESLAIGETLGETGKWICGWALMSLGELLTPSALARTQLERSTALFRELADTAQLSVALAHLAWFYIGQKEYPLAEATTQESLTLTEQVGDIMGAAWMLKLSGDLALAQADYAQATSRYQAALDRFKTLGSKLGIASALSDLGQVCFAQGDYSSARTLWEEALPLFEQIGQKEICDGLSKKLEQLDS